jgi:putative chitobiose transport system substrate-binding protein
LGGKVYVLPWYVSADVLIYNKAIFQEAGISSPPRTWSQVFQDARIIEEKTSKSGIAPLPLPGDWLQENGVQVISVRRQIATFDTPAGVRALQVYVNLVKQGIVGQDAVNYDYLRALNEYESGQLAMLATGPQFLVRIKDEAPKIYQVTGVTEYPLAKARWIPTPLMDLVVPKASAHPRQAAQFARFVTDGANQLAFSEIVAILPSVIRAAQNPFFHSHLNTLEGQALAISVDELKYGHDRVFGGCGGNDGNITSILEDAFTAAMLGNTTPAAALHHAAKKVDALLASCR